MSEHGDHMEEDEAFGDIWINSSSRLKINQIRNNDPALTHFQLERADAGKISDKGWELLGRYITNNVHLTHLNLRDLHRHLGALTNSKMSILFNSLTGSSSIINLSLMINGFGLSGIQCMVPFLKNCPHLAALDSENNRNFDKHCFRVIVEALDCSSVEELNFGRCNITDITTLANCNLPHLREIRLISNKICSVPSLEIHTSLQELDLRNNKIGNEGCRGIAKLLANKSSCLKGLYLGNNSIDDEGAEILASSLKHNTKLKTLSLCGNEIAERGWRAFLKLLNDVSSIERTYKCNHALEYIAFNSNSHLTSAVKLLMEHIKSALAINRERSFVVDYNRDSLRRPHEVERAFRSALEINRQQEGNSHAAGRAKVIATQLDSTRRRELCHLQGIEYSYGAMFAGIDSVLLPDLLALVGKKCDHNDLYHMLIATGPELFNMENTIKATIAKNAAQIKKLTAENLDMIGWLNQLHERGALSWHEFCDQKQKS